MRRRARAEASKICQTTGSKEAARRAEDRTRSRFSIRQSGEERDGEDEREIKVMDVEREINVVDLQGWSKGILQYFSQMKNEPRTS
jgi:hypothetical protein